MAGWRSRRKAWLAIAIGGGALFAGGVALGGESPPRATGGTPQASDSGTVSGTVVDKDSRGGRCSDRRSASRADSTRTPWCSLERAVEAAPDGSVVHVRAGRYRLLRVEGRQRDDGITIRPWRYEAVSIRGLELSETRGLRLERMRFTGVANLGPGARDVALVGNRMRAGGVTIQQDSRRILVEDNTVRAPRSSGVFLSAAPDEPPIADVTIRGNHFDGIGATGVNARIFENLLIEGNEFNDVRSWNGQVHPNVIRTLGGGRGLVVRGNFIHDNQAICFFIKDGKVSDVTFENNLIVRNACWGIQVYDVDGFRVLNNTIWDNKGGVLLRGDATRVVVKNNILQSLNVSSGRTRIDYEDFNHVAGGRPGGTGPSDIGESPRFVRRRTYDYRLSPGSPGIDAGTSEGTPSRDRRGRRRVDDPGSPNRGEGRVRYFDIGAEEFAGDEPRGDEEPNHGAR